MNSDMDLKTPENGSVEDRIRYSYACKKKQTEKKKICDKQFYNEPARSLLTSGDDWFSAKQ